MSLSTTERRSLHDSRNTSTSSPLGRSSTLEILESDRPIICLLTKLMALPILTIDPFRKPSPPLCIPVVELGIKSVKFPSLEGGGVTGEKGGNSIVSQLLSVDGVLSRGVLLSEGLEVEGIVVVGSCPVAVCFDVVALVMESSGTVTNDGITLVGLTVAGDLALRNLETSCFLPWMNCEMMI